MIKKNETDNMYSRYNNFSLKNASVKYNDGFLPDIIMLTQCYYHRGTRLNAKKRFCLCSLRSHLNVLANFPPDWGMLRRSTVDAFRFFFKQSTALLASQSTVTERNVRT